MGMVSWIGIALVATILALTLKQQQPIFSLMITIAAVLCLLWITAQSLSQLLRTLKSLADAAKISSGIYLPVLKAVGIAAAVRVAGAICKDAGQSALCIKLELLGSIAALAACLPLFEQLLSLVADMLG